MALTVTSAEDEFGAVFLDDFASHVEVGVLDRRDHVHERDVGGAHSGAGEFDLILLHESADAGDFGDALHAGELIAHVPVLNRAELRQIVAAVFRCGGIDVQVILIDPSESGGIGAELRLYAFRHRALEEIQAFEDACPRKVEIGAVFKDDGEKRETEHRSRPHFFDACETLETGGQRKGDLILDFLRAAPRPVRKNEHLVFCQVRDGVHGCEEDGAHPHDDEKQGAAGDEKAVPQTPVDDAFDHGVRADRLISSAHSSISLPKNGLCPARLPACSQRPLCGAPGIAWSTMAHSQT
jgi:hypothetical protein